MTRRDVERLVKLLGESGGDDLRLLRAQCDTLQGKMVCEWEAPDRDALTAWLEKHKVRFRGSEEWLMRVQMETRDGVLCNA